LDFANRLIAFNTTRHEKVLRAARPGGLAPGIVQCQDETDEAVKIVADIKLRLENPAIQRRDIAILCRTNEQPRPFEMELRREKLPYVLIGGQSFYDRREVKDILAYLRVLDNPRDEPSLLRIINTPPRGIGQSTVKTLLEQAVQQGKPMWDILTAPPTECALSPAASEAIARFRTLIESYQQRHDGKALAELATRLIAEVRYQDDLVRQYPDTNDQQSRWASIQELTNALAAYEKRAKKPTLRGFLDEVALGERDEASDKESKLNRNAIALMTLHSAKGLEFPHVYLVGLEEGLLPHQKSVDAEKNGDSKAIDEERRLCYVGVTRAKDRLTLSMALARTKWGKSRPTMPSRFLYELTGQSEKRAVPGAKMPASRKTKKPRQSSAR
jgi:DNA helicase-2/ATP-dependent DNA helicase PcrA